MTFTDKTPDQAREAGEKRGQTSAQQDAEALLRAIDEAQADLFRMTMRSGWQG